jgi:hypothetical protein
MREDVLPWVCQAFYSFGEFIMEITKIAKAISYGLRKERERIQKGGLCAKNMKGIQIHFSVDI